ncbi:MAG: ester cyclase [Anaerolineae bacterium]
MSKIELVKLVNSWDLADRGSYYTDDFLLTNATGDPPGDKSALLAMGDMMAAALPDISTVIEDVREEGDSVILTSHWEGTFANDFDLSPLGMDIIPATGKTVVFPTSTIQIDFDGDKICAIYDPGTGPDAGMGGFLKALGANGAGGS